MRPGRARRLPALLAVTIVLGAASAAAQPIQWQHRSPATGSALLAPDGAGNTYFMQSGTDLVVPLVKLDPAGTALWSVSLPGISGPFSASIYTQIVADPGNVYIRGSVGGGSPMQCPVGCTQSVVRRVAPSNGAFSTLYATPVSTIFGSAALRDLAAAPGGSAVMTGHLPAGGLIARAGAAPLEILFGQSFDRVVVLGSGAIVATAFDAGAHSLRRYDAAGALQWSVPLGASGCALLAASAAERVACAAGESITVYDAGGNVAWGPTPAAASAIAFDAAGDLFVAGRTMTCVVSWQCSAALLKFGSAGALLASDVVSTADTGSEWTALSIGPAGDVYVTGLSRPLGGGFNPSDMITARYTNAVGRLWLAGYAGSGAWNDLGQAIVATADGAVVGASLHDPAPTVAVIKYGAAVLVAPGLALSAAPDPGVHGEPVTLTATLTGATAPTGTVTFRDGPAVLCDAVQAAPIDGVRSTATCTVVLAAGSHLIAASYSGDGTFAVAVASVGFSVVGDEGAAAVPALAPPLLALLSVLVAMGAALQRRRQVRDIRRGRSDRDPRG